MPMPRVLRRSAPATSVQKTRAYPLRFFSTRSGIAAATALTLAVIAPMIPLSTQGGAAASTGRTVIDSSSSKISYSGKWRTTRSVRDSGGSVRFQSSAGSASLAFTGTSISYLTRTTASSGTSTVSIDGKVVSTINGYSAATHHAQTAFSTNTLTSGSHTITITGTGKKDARARGTNSIVDAFIIGATPANTPKPTLPVAPQPTPSVHRYADCPAATTTVRTSAQLRSAVKRARPGTVIKMTAGTYTGQINMKANGTARNPIWVCGPRNAVINVGGIADNHGIQIKNSSHLVVAGMTVTNSLKGISVISSSDVTVADTRITNIGYEGIHLRAFTTASTVVANVISHTGKRDAAFGEGIYIGTSENNWCAQTDCAPDHTDDTRILSNTISHTGAQPIEVKEGTSRGVIRGNVIDGTNAMAAANEWIKVKGNDWLIEGNEGANSPLHGFAVNGSVDGWGLGNTFSDNTGSVNAEGYGFFIYEKDGRGTSDTDVSCSNSVTRARDGFSNITCTP